MANQTHKTIEYTIEKLKTWGCFDHLTENEKESIKSDLRIIAGTAVMEANSKIQNILPNFYNELTK